VSNVDVSDNSNVTVFEVTEITDAIVEGWARLMPQLSSSAPPPSPEWLSELINSDSVLYVATQNGRMVGSLTLVLSRLPVGLKAWIEDVVVDEGVRGQRIGEKLTLAAIERAQQAGARNINLESRPSRVAAHKLYKRVGFEERETTVYRYAGPSGEASGGSEGKGNG
jgi:ribosomal protein S18 acetylase RimI-like enzyme